MSPTTTVLVSLPQDIEASAARVLRGAGLTVEDVVQAVCRQIAEQRSVPSGLVLPTPEEQARAKAERQERVDAAFERITALRRARSSPVATIGEIIAARDEARP